MRIIFLILILSRSINLLSQTETKLPSIKSNNDSSTDQAHRIQQESEDRLRHDWAFMKKYKSGNDILKKSGKIVNVVFIGNSITEAWSEIDSNFFIKNNYIDRGIGGQTSSQMLLRFRQDVINLHPKAVVILAGINDIAENMGPISLEDILGNIISMTQLAEANHIKVILCSVLPAYDFPWRPGLMPAEKIVKLNSLIREFANSHGLIYTDYYAAMVDQRKGLKKEYTEDGVHPTLPGYRVMESILQAAIRIFRLCR